MNKEKRRKLSDAAIAFIIEERDNPHTVYTFEEISKLVETEFKISISRNAVSKSYHKHKNNDAFRTLQVGKEDSKENQKKDNSVSDVPKNVKSKRINEPIIPVIIQNDFDEDAGKNYDVNDFFMKE
jgi:hypothetical protein